MCLANEFKTSKNELELKVWCLSLEFINNPSNDFQLLEERNLLFVIIEKHTRYMSVFNQKHILSDAFFQSILGHFFEEWNKFA
jgi:hypothetical protein